MSNPASPSMAARPQVYQIDFTAVASGKRVASTKRRVRWRFGFANPEALANGETGTACRGEEHDVTIVWSITSGKRLVLADGQEVHFSNSRNNIFEFSWTMKGNHVLKIVAHASPPMQANPGFRQYDFFVDGQSFFTFPKVFRLGLAANDPRGLGSPRSPPSLADGGRGYSGSSVHANSRRNASGGIASIEAPHNPDEEEAYLREAIKNSLKETYHAEHPSNASVQSAPVGGGDLLDFGAPAPPPGPGAMTPYAPSAGNDPWGAPTQQPYAALPPSNPPYQQQAMEPWAGSSSSYGGAPNQVYGAPPPASIPYGSSNQSGYDYVAPPVAGNDPFGAPAPSSNPYGAPPPQPSSNDPFSAQASSAPPQQPSSSDPFGAPAPQAPPSSNFYGGPPQQQPQQQMYGQPPSQQPAYTQQDQQQQKMYEQPQSQQYSAPPQPEQQPNPFGSPAPRSVSTSQDYTPASTIGFASPTAHYNSATAPEPAPAPTDPAAFTMSLLSGQETNLVSQEPQSNGGGSLADQAYGKFMSMDPFDLVKDKSDKKNPFEFSGSSSVVSNTASLADMKKTSSNQPKKSIMNSAPAGAMVLSNNQQGNFGGYGGQLGMGQQSMSGYEQPQQQQYGQPQMQQYGGQQQYGQPPMQQYGGQQQITQPQIQQYGGQQQVGQPMQQQQYGQSMQQQQYGQQPYGQQQQHGQPMQQQPWGGM